MILIYAMISKPFSQYCIEALRPAVDRHPKASTNVSTTSGSRLSLLQAH